MTASSSSQQPSVSVAVWNGLPSDSGAARRSARLSEPHGSATRRPGATLVTIEGGGHELHENDWDQILGAIADHTAARG